MMQLVLGGGALAMGGIHALTLWRWARAWRRAISKDEAEPIQPSKVGQTASWAVVIPARNEANGLSNLLDDLQVQSLDPVDIWIVDDHSEDDTIQIAQRHPLAQREHLRVVGNDGTGKKSAILTGMARANRSWVVTLDADVRLQPNWASSWASALNQISRQTAAIAGPVVLSNAPQDPGLWDGVQALDFAAQMGWSAGCLATQSPGSASGANLALRCDVYPDTRHMGASGDDTLVVQTLQQQGWQVDWLADPRAIVTTPGAVSVSEWVAQRLRWAGKTKHYPRRTQRTAWWMALMAASQWGLVGAALSDATRAHLANRRGMVGRGHRNECVVCKACGALVWTARERRPLAGFGPHPADAGSDAASCQDGASQFCGHPVPPNVERPNLRVVTAFLSHRMAVVGAAWILLWVTVALVGSPLRPDPSPMANAQHLERGMLSPGSTWVDDVGTTQTAWLGTDRYGRDLLSRLMAGSGISLSVGAGAVLISLLLGLLLGGMAGYLGVGWTLCCRGFCKSCGPSPPS